MVSVAVLATQLPIGIHGGPLDCDGSGFWTRRCLQ